jgi:hypothetical protein
MESRQKQGACTPILFHFISTAHVSALWTCSLIGSAAASQPVLWYLRNWYCRKDFGLLLTASNKTVAARQEVTGGINQGRFLLQRRPTLTNIVIRVR